MRLFWIWILWFVLVLMYMAYVFSQPNESVSLARGSSNSNNNSSQLPQNTEPPIGYQCWKRTPDQSRIGPLTSIWLTTTVHETTVGRTVPKKQLDSNGRGIVLCAGGRDYFPSAYMLVRELRHHGCTLPIEWWYNGEEEMNYDERNNLKEFNVTCFDLKHYAPFILKAPNLSKFAFKVLAMFMSQFDELLYLDADNNVLKDPTYLFDNEQYRTNGALFWPDYWPVDLTLNTECFLQLPTQFVPVNQSYTLPYFQQESGQLLINKKRANGVAQIYLWQVYCVLEQGLQHLFPPPFEFGDKDLFWLTWLAHGEPFGWMTTRPCGIGYEWVDQRRGRLRTVGMGQHDDQGELVFIHMNHQSWGDRTDASTRWWIWEKRFLDPIQGTAEGGIWCPVGPQTVSRELDSIEPLERIYLNLWKEMVSSQHYRY